MGLKPRRVIERRGESGLTPEELERLISGFNILDGDDPAWATDDEARRQVWLRHREYVMSLQGKPCQGESFAFQRGTIHFPLFSRPHAWWQYDAPEPRRLLSGDPVGRLPEHGLLFGKPKMFRDWESYNSMVFESEEAYLERLGLLNDAENAALRNPKKK